MSGCAIAGFHCTLYNERTGDLYNDEADNLEDGDNDCYAINAVKQHGGFDDDTY